MATARASLPDRYLLQLALLMPLSACGNDLGPIVVPPLPTHCTGAGSTHAGALAGDRTWLASAGPHWLEGNVTVAGVLTVESGALVCARSGSSLTAARFEVNGTAERPVRFTSAGTATVWNGIRTPGDALNYDAPASVIRHARFERAVTAIETWAPLELSAVEVVGARGIGIIVGAGVLEDVLVDEPCIAPDGPCAGIHLGQYGGVVLDRVTVVSSGDRGIATNRRSHHTFRNVRILGSAGIGLDLNHLDDGDFGTVTFEGPLRITGGASRPAALRLAVAMELMAQPWAADSLRGNAEDLIEVWTSITPELSLTVDRRVGWIVHSSSNVEPALDLAMEPGSRLRLRGGTFHLRGVIEGTADEPIEIGGQVTLAIQGATADTSALRHVRLDNTTVLVSGAHVLHAENVAATNVTMRLHSPGSTLQNVSFTGVVEAADHVRPKPLAVLTAGGGVTAQGVRVEGSPVNGIWIEGDDVVIRECAVTKSAVDGIRVAHGAGVVINDCNLVENGGVGLLNAGTSVVDGRNNWWGSADGPGGEGGDGVAGIVTVEPFRTSAHVLAPEFVHRPRTAQR